jgi:hypothetical protein
MVSTCTAARRVPEGDQEKRKEDKRQGVSGRTYCTCGRRETLEPPHPLKLQHLLNLMCLWEERDGNYGGEWWQRWQ